MLSSRCWNKPGYSLLRLGPMPPRHMGPGSSSAGCLMLWWRAGWSTSASSSAGCSTACRILVGLMLVAAELADRPPLTANRGHWPGGPGRIQLVIIGLRVEVVEHRAFAVFERGHFQVAFGLALRLPLRHCLAGFVWRFHGGWRHARRRRRCARRAELRGISRFFTGLYRVKIRAGQ